MTEEKKGAAEEPKGVAEQFVGVLGLLDIISGGIALYWIRLRGGPNVAAFLPSTGFQFLDIALLACAAAFLGKVITLAVVFFMAVVAILIEKGRYFGDISTALTTFRDRRDIPEPPKKMDVADLAAEYVANLSPGRRANLDRIIANATLAYSGALLATAYAWYFAGRTGIPSPWWRSLAGGAILFGLLGVLQQLDYYQTLGVSLAALIPGDQDARATDRGES